MNNWFKGKHAVITGGINGIGRCVANKFHTEGSLVSIIDVDNNFHKKEGISFFHGDIALKDDLEKFVDSLNHPVDFIINNACATRKGLLSNCSWEDFEYIQSVGVTAPYYLTKLILEKNSKINIHSLDIVSIINIASTRAFQSQADTESYSAAKGGIVALTHSLSVSLAGRARVNAISPGWIELDRSVRHNESDNNQHAAGRVGKPDDIAEMVLFLCDNNKAGFITGQNFIIDGGMNKLMVYHNDHGWKYEKEK